jgi:hypothetical protein
LELVVEALYAAIDRRGLWRQQLLMAMFWPDHQLHRRQLFGAGLWQTNRSSQCTGLSLGITEPGLVVDHNRAHFTNGGCGAKDSRIETPPKLLGSPPGHTG